MVIVDLIFHLGFERQRKQLGELGKAAVNQILRNAVIDDHEESQAFLNGS